MPRIIIIITVLVFLGVIVGGVFLWWPEYQEFMELRKELEDRRIALEQKRAYFAELKEISQKLEDYQEEFEKIDSAFPEKPLIPAIMNFIQNIASENGLVAAGLGDYNVSLAGEGKFREIAFSGSYSALKSFLSAIYNNARIIEVETITFGSSEEGGEIFEFKVGFKTHAFPAEKEKEQILEEGAFPIPKRAE